MGCKKGESNLTQSATSPTASASPTPVAQATPTRPPDTNRTAKFIVLLYHRFEDRPAELVSTPNDFRAQMKALKDNGVSVISYAVFCLKKKRQMGNISLMLYIAIIWDTRSVVDTLPLVL